MKILLVQPPLNPNILGANFLYLTEPIALEVIAATVPGQEVKILDLRLESGLDSCLADFKPDIVGVTAYTPDVYMARRVLKEVKDYNPNILTIVGGHHATLLPEDFFGEFIDVIVIGEGEHTFPELVNAYESGERNYEKINGLAFSQGNGKLFRTKKRKLLDCLDDTPLPARHLTEKLRQHYFRLPWRPVASMTTSRGCPYRCNFCSVWKYDEGRYRTQSPERVLLEVLSIKEEHISIADDNFLQDYQRAKEICSLLKKSDVKKSYKLIGRSDTVVRHPDLIEEWKEIGMEMVFLGLESFRDKELQQFNKRASVRDNEEAVRILHANQVKVAGHFIISPDYTKEDFEQLGDYVRKMGLSHPVFSVLTPLPGTDFYTEVRDQLLTNNYEMFDLVHSVLPTKLPREEFYQRYAELYRKCYSSGENQGKSFFSSDALERLLLRLREAYRLEQPPSCLD